MTLTYFIARPTWVAHAFEWGKLVKCNYMGGLETCWEYANGQKNYVYGKNVLRGLSDPAPGLYTCIYMTIIFKPLL